jgi:hypothetical protein
VNEIREISFARWDADRRLWIVPYRSYDELRRRWPVMEAAAARNEPEVKKARRNAMMGTEEEEASKATLRERRRRRYPVLAGDVPPFERAIGTHAGVFVFTGMEGELADPATVSTYYFPANLKDEHVWASWRPGSLEACGDLASANATRRTRTRTRLVAPGPGGLADRSAKGQIKTTRPAAQARPGRNGVVVTEKER